MFGYAKVAPIICPIYLKLPYLGIPPDSPQVIRPGFDIGDNELVTHCIGIGLTPEEIVAFYLIKGVAGHIIAMHIKVIKEYLSRFCQF